MNPDTFVVFLLPPLVGAVIGLFTNWLAIKMLFRPLREYRVLGLRVPFTPGILPRERHRIAQSLGDTVAKDLLTPDALADRLGTEEFRVGLRGALVPAIDRILSATPGEMAGGTDPRLGRALRDAAAGAVRSIAESAAFSAAVHAAVDTLSAELGPVPLASIADSAPARALARRLSQPEVKDGMARAAAAAVFSRLDEASRDGLTLSQAFRLDAAADAIVSLAGAAYPKAGGLMMGILSEPGVRKSLERAAAKLLRRAIDRFNAIQRFFIGLGQYDKAILENVPATVSDFIESLGALMDEQASREAILGAAEARLREFLARPVSSLAMMASPEAREASFSSLFSALRTVLDAMDPAGLPEALKAGAAGRTLGEALGDFPGLRDGLAAASARWLAGLLSGAIRPGTGDGTLAAAGAGGLVRAAGAFAGGLRQGFDGLALREILGADEGFATRLAEAVAGPLAALALRESAGMLQAIDVRALVVAKIDSLDIIEIERMLLRVMDRELKAVTWFGAVLGGLMGAIQSVLGLIR